MKTLAALFLCIIVASVLASGELKQSADPFHTSLRCSPQYRIGENAICKFSVTNTHDTDYSVLKIGNPLEGMFCAYLSVSRNGKLLAYDGFYGKRSALVPEAYTRVKARSTLVAKINLCEAYAVNSTGRYSINLNTNLVYHPGRPGDMSKQPSKQKISHNVQFLVYGHGTPRMTEGEHYRHLAEHDRQERATRRNEPLNPKFEGGSTKQREVTKQIHRATHLYAATAGTDIDDNRAHYVKWFGAANPSRITKVKKIFSDIKNKLERTTFTYVFNDPRCRPEYFGFTTHGSTTIYLCGSYDPSSDLFGVDTKLCTVLHELTHAVSFTDDVEYGRRPSLDLAKNKPADAVRNADSYCYFAETTNVFDYGFDSLVVPPNGVCYGTKGNVYLKYISITAGTIAKGYPKLIRGNWGDLPGNFLDKGFDSMATLPNRKTYATQDNQFIRYSNANANKIDAGYNPKRIQGNWGNIPSNFNSGFDSMSTLPNGKTYITKGNRYVRYSDNSASKVDNGYPRPLQGNWGKLPANFAACFDAMAALPDGKTYVTRGKNYIQYSDASASNVEAGYPKRIRGNWGTIKWPGPH